jgi:hypothetical protein
VFNRAKQVGAIRGVNPLDNTKAGGTKKKFKGVAYNLDVIQDMLEKLPDPAEAQAAMEKFGRVLDPKRTQAKTSRKGRSRESRINIDVFALGARSSAVRAADS